MQARQMKARIVPDGSGAITGVVRQRASVAPATAGGRGWRMSNPEPGRRVAAVCVAAVMSMIAAEPVAGQTDDPAIPIKDMVNGETYGGYAGLLYPGSNEVPPDHLALAIAMSEEIVPRDVDGRPDPVNGLIGFIALGVSITAQEFGTFERLQDQNPGRNPRVVIVDTVRGGANSGGFWELPLAKLEAAGLSRHQVQVLWFKSTGYEEPDNFPVHAQELRDLYVEKTIEAKDWFPNLALAYFTSRSYGGYALNDSSPEPQAYEEGFSAKWAIERQLSGHPSLNADPAKGPVEAPVMLWGPYWWAEGATPNSCGVVWLPEDFEEGDLMHPSDIGQLKAATLLAEAIEASPTSTAWWPDPGDGFALQSVDATDDTYVRESAPDANYGNKSVILFPPPANSSVAYWRFELPPIGGRLVYAKFSLVVKRKANCPFPFYRVDDDDWTEGTVTWNNRPALPAEPVRILPENTRDATVTVDVTELVRNERDGVLTLAMTMDCDNWQSELFSTESEGDKGARLVLLVGPPCPADCNADGSVNIFDLLCFQGLVLQDDPAADCDGDGDIDIFDLLCFQGLISLGCE